MWSTASAITAVLALAFLAGDVAPMPRRAQATGPALAHRNQEQGATYLGRGRWRFMLASGLTYDGYPTEQPIVFEHAPRAGSYYSVGSQ